MKNSLCKLRSVAASVDLFRFIYLNFFSKCIVRERGCYFIPYRNCVINLAKNARIYIKDGSIRFGTSKLRGSRAEAYLSVGENAAWYSKGGAELFCRTQLDIQKNALFETGYFSANCGTVIVCSKKITLGENIMMGRNIMIYDSDHHQIVDRNGYMINGDAEVTIEDHVWLTSDVTVLRGVTIGEGSIITAQTVIKEDLPSYSLASGCSSVKVVSIKHIAGWRRNSTRQQEFQEQI